MFRVEFLYLRSRCTFVADFFHGMSSLRAFHNSSQLESVGDSIASSSSTYSEKFSARKNIEALSISKVLRRPRNGEASRRPLWIIPTLQDHPDHPDLRRSLRPTDEDRDDPRPIDSRRRG